MKISIGRGKATLFLLLLFVVTFLLTTAGLLMANNQWYCWHWSKNTIGAATMTGDHYWGPLISSEFGEWDTGTCVDFTGGSEITGDAGFYGSNGWLGLARILDYDAGACEILRAEALMNRSYLDGGSYDDIDDRHVACQEQGHDLGLDHRKGPRNQTCMNDQFLGFPDFDEHDAQTVEEITGGCSSGGSEPPAGGGSCDNGGEKGKKKCTDGVDNDSDGCTDGADPDCGKFAG